MDRDPGPRFFIALKKIIDAGTDFNMYGTKGLSSITHEHPHQI